MKQLSHNDYTIAFPPLTRWFVYKHSKPLPADIVKFQPYPDSEDCYRGTTVLPYLEAFFNYGVDDSGMNTLDRGATASKLNLH